MLGGLDAANLFERQMKVVHLEAENLKRLFSRLDSFLQPKLDDFPSPPDVPKPKAKMTICCECSEDYEEDGDPVFCPKCREKEKNRG